MSPSQQQTLDAKFGALSDGTRRALIERLTRGPSSVKDLARPMPVSLPTVLKHLAVLERGGIVRSRKRGRVRTFRLAPTAFHDVQLWLEARKAHWNQALDRLDKLLSE